MKIIISCYALFSFIMICFLLFHSKNRKNNVNRIYPLSVLIPCYNEGINVCKTIQSVIENQYTVKYEIILIDDGATPKITTLLLRRHDCIEIDLINSDIKTKEINSIYLTYIHKIPIYIVNKENGKKADALNCGLNISHYDYVLTIDGDSLLDSNAITNIMSSISDDVIAVGGQIKPIGSINKYSIDYLLTFLQQYEYTRAFYLIRVAYNSINTVPILSGAFSLFRKEILISLNGYNTQTNGEDFDCTLRLYQYAMIHNKTITYNKNAICYTQVPFQINSLWNQRIRWHLGLIDGLKNQKQLLFHFNRMAIVLWIMKLYEEWGWCIEWIIIIYIKEYSLYLLSLYMALSALITYISLRKSEDKIPIRIFYLTILDLLFHFFSNINKFIATLIYFIPFFKSKKEQWQIVERKDIL